MLHATCFVSFVNMRDFSGVDFTFPSSCNFGGLEVACWPLVPKFAGSNPAEAVGFFRAKKNPQHAFLQKASKAVCPMSQIYGI